MLSTNNHVILLMFRNTTEKLIFNTSIDSIVDLKNFVSENHPYNLDKVLLFDLKDNKFKRVRKDFILQLFSFESSIFEYFKKGL